VSRVTRVQSVGRGSDETEVYKDRHIFSSFFLSRLFQSFHFLCTYQIPFNPYFLTSNSFLRLQLFLSFTMREVISVHVGQAGVQIGHACCKSQTQFSLIFPPPRHEIILPNARSYFLLNYDSHIDVSILFCVGELYTVEHGLTVR
jgi:hypothetical protein